MISFGTYVKVLASITAWPTNALSDSTVLARCAVQLLNVSNPMRTTVYVTASPEITDDFRAELLLAVHRNYNPAMLLRRFDVELFNPNRYVLPHAYLVAARDVTDLVDHLDTINVTDPSWQPEANFVVALETPTGRLRRRALEPVFRRFWANNVFRSILVVPSPADGATDALAWYPFRNRCGAYHNPVTVNTCGRPADGGGRWSWRRNAADAFEKRIPEAFNGCTVRVAGFKWPPMTVLSDRRPRTMLSGMDVEVIKLMGRIGNVRPELTEVADDQRWGVKSTNGTWNGGFGDLSNGRADVLIGGGIMTPERMEMFDSAPARQVIRFPMYTPLPKRLPYWRNLSNVFSGTFWTTLFGVFVLTSGLLWLSGRHVPSERRAFADLGYCVVLSWAILCGVPGGRPPGSLSSKMVFLSWVIYTLHVSVVYTSMQIIYLYKPSYERPMRTINDVKRSGMTVCSVPTFIPIAQSMAEEDFNLTEYVPCADMAASADRLLRRNDVVVLDPEDHFEALVSGSMDQVNKVEEVVIVYNIGMYVQKGNPYKRILTRAQIAAYETGLHGKWRRDASPTRRPLSKKERPVKVKKLNVDELQGAFIILVCGLFSSLVVFLFEWFHTLRT